MRDLIKKFVPHPLIDLGLKLPIYLALKYYSNKYKPLIIREGTSDINVFKQIFVLRDYNIKLNIKPKLIIDAGAYVGYSSLYFSSMYPDAQIIAIEPEESNFKMLEKHTRDISNIKRIKAGLWYKDSLLKIVDEGLGKWGVMTKEVSKQKDYDIKGITIDTILKGSNFDEIDILKIDIEGAEKELFSKNFESWLGKVNILIIELHDRLKEGCSESFYSAMNKYQWKEIKKGENLVFIKVGI